MNKNTKIAPTILLRILSVWIIILLTLNCTCHAVKHCPYYCKCDLYEGRNRADCSAERLINPYVDLSTAVEILDLSYNDIAIIDESCFANYRRLINLTITHNDVHTIYLDAFVKLRRLSLVNLAYNRLEYLDERLFEANRHLQELNLEGNKFAMLPSRPLLRSTSLRVLNLANAGINYVGAELLTALPQLTDLDLSQNVMITINAAAFNAPKHLERLLLDENPWTCDKALVTAVTFVRRRGVNVSISDCDAFFDEALPNKQTPMFERMEIMPSHVDQNDANKVVAENRTLNWRDLSTENDDSDDTVNYDDDMVDFANYISDKRTSDSRLSLLGISVDEKLCEGTQENLCRRYRNCLEQVSHVLINQMHTKKENSGSYTQNDINFAFLLGTVVGVTSIVFIVICALCCKNLFEITKIKRADDLEAAAMYEPVPTQTVTRRDIVVRSQPPTRELTPSVRQSRRRARRSAPNPPTRALVRRDQGADNFIARLFGRPARHQYYRTLNQNTATLIRRLSRSNLFNNRLSQHFTDRDNSNGSSNVTTPQSEEPTNLTLTADASPIRLARPETPPPNYGDIVDRK